MKKQVVFTVVAAAMVIFAVNNAFAGGAVKIGIDFNGDHELSGPVGVGSITCDANTGVSIAAELFGDVHPNVDLGGGVIFQLPRSAEYQGTDIGQFNFIPIYGRIRLKGTSDDVAPYGFAQLGYNFLMSDNDYTADGEISLEGGLYYGLGGGLLIKKRFSVEFLYSVNNGKWEYSGNSADVENKQFTLNVGFNF